MPYYEVVIEGLLVAEHDYKYPYKVLHKEKGETHILIKEEHCFPLLNKLSKQQELKIISVKYIESAWFYFKLKEDILKYSVELINRLFNVPEYNSHINQTGHYMTKVQILWNDKQAYSGIVEGDTDMIMTLYEIISKNEDIESASIVFVYKEDIDKYEFCII